MKRIKVTLTEKQIDTLLRIVNQEFHFGNSAAEIKHLEGLENTLIKQLNK
tara:strand:- start:273 stop:422 length:150 start_codon:yes stop_codon:yes gene_type:complete